MPLWFLERDSRTSKSNFFLSCWKIDWKYIFLNGKIEVSGISVKAKNFFENNIKNLSFLRVLRVKKRGKTSEGKKKRKIYENHHNNENRALKLSLSFLNLKVKITRKKNQTMVYWYITWKVSQFQT